MMNIYEMQIEMQRERNSKIIIFVLTFDIIIMDDEADSNADIKRGRQEYNNSKSAVALKFQTEPRVDSD